jgi:hypothetical protein
MQRQMTNKQPKKKGSQSNPSVLKETRTNSMAPTILKNKGMTLTFHLAN